MSEYAQTPLPELAGVADLIASTVVQGVPVLWAPGPGPLAAGLVFRVGRADESLPVSGITHLVEHLALFGQFDPVNHNGATGDHFTHFVVNGEEQEVVDYLNRVCAALRDLPFNRLDTEKAILQTEAQTRGSGNDELHRQVRFGATGLGISGYPQFGLDVLGVSQVGEWAAEWFTRENAVLWIMGDRIPPGLDLDLPSGVRHPITPTRSVQSLPAYFTGAAGSVLIDAVLPRSSAAVLFAQVASKALFRTLRVEAGVSYTAECGYVPIDKEQARLLFFADALPHQQSALIGGVVDGMAALREGVFDERDVSAAREVLRASLLHEHAGASMLMNSSFNILTGNDILRPEQTMKEIDAVTVAELRAIAERAWANAIWQIPEGNVEWAGVPPTTASENVIEGTSFDRVDDQSRLVLGVEGVSRVTDDTTVTVRWDESALLLAVPDGGRAIIGLDGLMVPIEPTLVRRWGPEHTAFVDAAFPPERVVMQPARRPENIPQPDPHAMAGQRKGWGLWALIVGLVLAAYSAILIDQVIYRSRRIGLLDEDGDRITASDTAALMSVALPIMCVALVMLVNWLRRRLWKRKNGIR